MLKFKLLTSSLFLISANLWSMDGPANYDLFSRFNPAGILFFNNDNSPPIKSADLEEIVSEDASNLPIESADLSFLDDEEGAKLRSEYIELKENERLLLGAMLEAANIENGLEHFFDAWWRTTESKNKIEDLLALIEWVMSRTSEDIPSFGREKMGEIAKVLTAAAKTNLYWLAVPQFSKNGRELPPVRIYPTFRNRGLTRNFVFVPTKAKVIKAAFYLANPDLTAQHQIFIDEKFVRFHHQKTKLSDWLLYLSKNEDRNINSMDILAIEWITMIAALNDNSVKEIMKNGDVVKMREFIATQIKLGKLKNTRLSSIAMFALLRVTSTTRTAYLDAYTNMHELNVHNRCNFDLWFLNEKYNAFFSFESGRLAYQSSAVNL